MWSIVILHLFSRKSLVRRKLFSKLQSKIHFGGEEIVKYYCLNICFRKFCTRYLSLLGTADRQELYKLVVKGSINNFGELMLRIITWYLLGEGYLVVGTGMEARMSRRTPDVRCHLNCSHTKRLSCELMHNL